jgi:phenylalanyl-tRNA synthetase beta chain
MRVSYKWLQEYVRVDLTPQELAFKLTMAGLEVEEVESTLPAFSGIIVAKVLQVNKHPNADRLYVCEVFTGREKLQVVCGAPNVAAGQTVAFAPVGVSLPNGVQINQVKIRGVESSGMICSEAELAISNRADGIWELPARFKVGRDLHTILEAGQDYILEINITPNRPDAMSMIGIARETAALTAKRYRYPKIAVKVKSEKAADHIRIKIRSKGCPRYSARIIRNVKIAPSPQWLAERLTAAGIRPINNVVDITNFVLMEFGQPLHAFDLSKITGRKIIVRDAKPGEKFVTLDGKERELPARTVMICDAEKTVAIGGIMGGLNSEVSDSTIDVLLESAYFSPASISVSSRQLGLTSEASQRFERGIDPSSTTRAADRAATLMAEIAGGEILKGTVDIYPQKIKAKKITLRPARVNLLLGTNLTSTEINRILGKLEIRIKGQTAVIPTFRPDLEREIDLIEEVARIYDFQNIPTSSQAPVVYEQLSNPEDQFLSYLKNQVRELGLTEVITNSMIARRDLQAIGDQITVIVRNPISDDMNVMRPSLIPGLLKTVLYNLNRNMTDIRIYELGRVFLNSDPADKNAQPYFLSGVIIGAGILPRWDRQSLPVDFYDIKGLVESFLLKISLDNVDLILYDNHVYFDPEQSIAIRRNDEIIGYLGRIRAEVARQIGIENTVFGFEFNVQKLYRHIDPDRRYQPFSKFPYTEKDLAIVVEKNISSADIRKVISEAGGNLLTFVEVFDVYAGESIEKTKKSLAFRLRFQSLERTLTDSEINILFNKIIRATAEKLNARLRE